MIQALNKSPSHFPHLLHVSICQTRSPVPDAASKPSLRLLLNRGESMRLLELRSCNLQKSDISAVSHSIVHLYSEETKPNKE
ncbi:hypothetical protein QQF64_005359 [Cirrhinus molitorella]|uniref:Uncharacterized protein n=1 Tax=Cirrhinus molitorella TaxID=172907 RepID=A0ABR3MCH6_9TELE